MKVLELKVKSNRLTTDFEPHPLIAMKKTYQKDENRFQVYVIGAIVITNL